MAGVPGAQPRQRARSQYKQVKLVITEQPGRYCSVRLAMKDLNSDWRDTDYLIIDEARITQPLDTTEQVVTLVIDLLRRNLLPGIG